MYSKNPVLFSVILFLITSLPLMGQSDYKVLSSGNGELTIEYTPQIKDIGTTQAANQTFKKIQLQNGDISRLKAGDMQLPSRFFQVGVSDSKQCRINILSTEFRELSGVLPPIPRAKKNKGSLEYVSEPGASYSVAQYFPSDLARISSTGSMRSVPIAEVQINPVQCNPVDRKIRLLTKIVFSVSFPAATVASSAKEDELLKDAIVNYSVAKQFKPAVAKKVKQVTSTGSALATGKWVRFETSDEGIYKITGDMLSSMGFDISSLDPGKIKVFNNGGKTLSETVTASRPIDLQEVAVYCSSIGTKFYFMAAASVFGIMILSPSNMSGTGTRIQTSIITGLPLTTQAPLPGSGCRPLPACNRRERALSNPRLHLLFLKMKRSISGKAGSIFSAINSANQCKAEHI
jgi:hypothetical protein